MAPAIPNSNNNNRSAHSRRSRATTKIAMLMLSVLLLPLVPDGAVAKRTGLPDVFDECPSFLELKPLAGENLLSDEDRLALADLRALVRSSSTGSGANSPPSIFNLGGLFVAIDPGLDGASRDKFEPHTMFLATRINRVNYEITHRIRTPRYRFLSFISQGPLTTLRFFGDSDIEIGMTGAGDLTKFSVRTMPADPEFERRACDDDSSKQ